MKQLYCLIFILVCHTASIVPATAQVPAPGSPVRIGVLPHGTYNAITDVAGVRVGHKTLIRGASVRTGATVILPHGGNLFQEKVPAAVYVGNGFGKLAGITQIKELGNIESPVILTNTLNVAAGINAGISYTLAQKENQQVQSVNIVVGETNDGYLNDIRGRHVTEEDILDAIRAARSGAVEQGNTGAGTGTVCFGFKGGIGSASRVLPKTLGGYTVGVLVQTNFGGVLEIAGVPVGKELGRYFLSDQLNNPADGSCMIVLATDAPLLAPSLERLAKRAFMGLAKTGGIASNGSGDYVIAFSTHPSVRIPHRSGDTLHTTATLFNDDLSPLFLAAIEATEEAIINALFAAKTMTGRNGNKIEALPKEAVISILKKYNRYQP
ncbi:DmpA family aminopeptidase [Niabella drilacis]|uniref:L-aminopeptidase DmpA. Serine peptidase. MEROPS family S58 n=1 Tax=Niabella drilacis (strain DSM 25811 / CCM 8410 / CCUG 62505 / LMG 26954 / E90) TaxID=1285928 RepID=A0A1G6N2A7_NIADE|nr:P1 family peptidase [Niabella drilacis]SDC61594.1 L-aminopeptidase DmpA. Serine peptidase. MEROPS family S58 [Niabella drilacis]